MTKSNSHEETNHESNILIDHLVSIKYPKKKEEATNGKSHNFVIVVLDPWIAFRAAVHAGFTDIHMKGTIAFSPSNEKENSSTMGNLSVGPRYYYLLRWTQQYHYKSYF